MLKTKNHLKQTSFLGGRFLSSPQVNWIHIHGFGFTERFLLQSAFRLASKTSGQGYFVDMCFLSVFAE